MLYPKDNLFLETSSPHSLGLKNNMTIATPGFDSNPLMINQKKDWGAGNNNTVKAGLQGLTFDGTGLLGTGLFSGDITTWGMPEILAGAVGAYALYSMVHQTKQTGYRLEQGARKRRVSKASRLRQKAKSLEDKEGGYF